jgi:hypothetical protein
MRRMRILTERAVWRGVGLMAVVALASGAASCGSVVRQGRSPVYLVLDSLEAAPGNDPGSIGNFLLSDVAVETDPCSAASPCWFNDVGTASLRVALKNPGDATNPAAPTTFNDVTVTRVHVAYRRADGHNTPGVDVPYAFDGAATGTIPAGGTAALTFEIVRHDAKRESPLIELANSSTIITTIADVTFYGTDQAGNEVTVTGSIQVDFGNFADKA